MFKKMKAAIRAELVCLWAWLDGKKTNIAVIYWSVLMPSLAVWYPDGVPSDINKVVAIIGVMLSAAGLGHKIQKASVQS